MNKTNTIEELKAKVAHLETQVKHLTNELTVTQEENETSMCNYFDLFSNMERKVAERTQELSDLQQKLEIKGRELEIMLDAAPGMIFYKDTQQRYIRVNREFGAVLGVSVDRVIGKTHSELFPGNRHAIFNDDSEVMSTGRPVLDRIERIRTTDGSEKVLLTSKIPYKNKDGQVIGIIGFVQDVTEQKKTEEEKKVLQKRILRSEKMEAIGTLAGGVAHDLNNILSGIVSYPDLILMDLAADDPLRKRIRTIRSTGQKAAAIVQDLLTLARRGVAAVEVVSPNDILKDYLESPEYESLRQHHPHVDVKVSYSADLLNIFGSPIHLSKTIMNLVSNAAEAMPEGGTITVSTENRYIDQPISGYDDVDEGDYAVVTVSDTGVGIRHEDKERIFEPFYTKKVMGRSGTGLGMAVVWGTIKDHNGYIDIQSCEGNGTTFTLYFPVTRKTAPKNQPAMSLDAFRGKGESVLIVDDVPEQREMANEILSVLGYNPVTVPSGEKAVEYMMQNTADILVLDMIMEPGIDGLETYRRISQFHPNQRAVIASGFSETDRVREAQRLGAGAYVRKPYTLENIGMAIRATLDEAPSQQGEEMIIRKGSGFAL